MFNKEHFKIKLEFYVRHWHAVGAAIMKGCGEQEAQITLNFFWAKALEILWQTRNEDTVIIFIDDPDRYHSFCSVLTIGLNQLNDRIRVIQESDIPYENRICSLQVEIKDIVASLSDDVEELLNTKIVKDA